MASTEATAGSAIQAISPALNAVPYVGPILSILGSVGGGLLESDAAKKQQQQGLQMQKDALATPMTPLAPEYLAALHNQMLMAHSDMPGFQQNKELLSQQLADQIRGIRMSSPSGNATLAAIGNSLANQSRGAQNLGIANAQYQNAAQQKANEMLWNVGDARVANEAIQREQRNKGLTSASQMLNSAMLNKQTGANQIIGGITAGVSDIEKNTLLNKAYNPTGAKTTSTGAAGGATVNYNPNAQYGFNTNDNMSLPFTGTPTPLLDTSHASLFTNGQLNAAGRNYYSGAPMTTPASYMNNGSTNSTQTQFNNPFAPPAAIAPDVLPTLQF